MNERPDQGTVEDGRVALLARISARTGLAFPEDRIPAAVEAVSRAMRTAGDHDVRAYRRRVEGDRAVFDALIDALTIGETYFFRDDGQFEFIGGPFVEEMQRPEANERTIRVWSAGCATGEEVWSLAMLFDEAGLSDRTEIVGTDLSPRALERAEEGVYRPWSIRGIGGERARQWLDELGDRHHILPNLRRMVRFERLNLAAETYPLGFSGFDLVLCRNVLIYFDPATVAAVARRLFDALRPGGWLILGASDPGVAQHAGFEVVESCGGILFRRPDPFSAPVQNTLPREYGSSDPWANSFVALPVEVGGGVDSPASPHAKALPSEDLTRAVSPLRANTASKASEDETTTEATEDDVDVPTLLRRIQLLANTDAEAALRLAAAESRRHEVVAELHYLEAVLLADLGRHTEAAETVRRALFLDRNLVVAYMLLGSIRYRLGERESARRAFANAARCCANLPDDAVLPLSDGECAGRMAELASCWAALVERSGGRTSPGGS